MSPKFFLFNKEPINSGSTTESDSGVGLSIIALQAQNLSYISAKTGTVTMVFNNSGVYDFVQLPDNEGFKKTVIDVTCEIGEEQSLIQEILNFISSSSTNKTVMNFVYSGNSSFSKAEVTSTKDISSRVHVSPELLAPKKILLRDTGLTAFDIDGIEFSESSYPLIDYSPMGMSAGGTATAATGGVGLTYESNVSSWTNNSQLPNTVGPTGYDLTTALVSGPTRVYPGVASSTGVGTTGMLFTKGRFMQLSTSGGLEVPEDYTTYIAFGIPDDTSAIDSMDPVSFTFNRLDYRTLCSFYGDFSGSFAGFIPTSISSFGVRHGSVGAPAIASTASEDGGSVAYKVPDNRGVGVQQTCYVFVIRRDRKRNVFVHNHEGDIICVIPFDGKDNGPLSFLSLGYGRFDPGKNSESDNFWGVITRFGVITSDIGPSEASRLARALYEKYKPLK